MFIINKYSIKNNTYNRTNTKIVDWDFFYIVSQNNVFGIILSGEYYIRFCEERGVINNIFEFWIIVSIIKWGWKKKYEINKSSLWRFSAR